MLINVVTCLIILSKITAPLVQPLLTDCVDKPPMEAAFLFMETWKEVKGETAFMVSDFGNVMASYRKKWNGTGWQTLKPKILKRVLAKKSGYLVVSISNKVRYVHRLVAEVFITDSPFYGMDVNHKDGNKTNNNLSNLEWCDRKYNINHAFDNSLIKVGDKHHSAKWSNEIFESVKAKHKETGLGAKALRDNYFPNIPRTTISAFIHGYRRKRK